MIGSAATWSTAADRWAGHGAVRDVKERYHDPLDGVIVRYVDLTHGESIGVSRPAEDIWEVIGHVLGEDKVLSPGTDQPA